MTNLKNKYLIEAKINGLQPLTFKKNYKILSCSVEHCVSSAKVVGSIPREHTYWQYKCINWMLCKSLWIKVSAKCINVNENILGGGTSLWQTLDVFCIWQSIPFRSKRRSTALVRGTKLLFPFMGTRTASPRGRYGERPQRDSVWRYICKNTTCWPATAHDVTTGVPQYKCRREIHHQLFRLHWLVCLKRAEWIW